MTYGNYSLAFPVRNYENKIVCSLSIVGPLSRVNNQKLKEYMYILRDASMDASERLGFEE
jgi:DNA-binding IclR family transcriptional regulator